MNTLVIGHEVRTLVRAPAFIWILLLLAGALAFGAWSGAQSMLRQERGAQEMAAAAAETREGLRSGLESYEQRMAETGGPIQIAVYSHSPRGAIPQGTNAGSVGLKADEPAILPFTGLGAFAVGQSDIQLSYVPVNTESITRVLQDSELGNPVNLLRGAFDLSFVVIFVLPIFILAISYDMLSSEKERGTLAMVLSHPISLRKLMTSKVISRAAIVVAVVFALGLGALLFAGRGLDTIETWARFGLWTLSALLYAMFWFALSVLVNALGKNSATNGIILAGAWLVLVVVAPVVISVAATTAYPTPSRFDFITASRSAQTEAERDYMGALNQYYYDHVEYAPDGSGQDFLAVTRAKGEAVARAVDPIYQRFRSQRAQQDRMVSMFQFLTPALMMQSALNDISGVGSARYSSFIDQVQAFHQEWVSYFTTRFLQERPLASSEFADFPRFTFQEESFGALMMRVAPRLLGLLILGGLAALASVVALRRYQAGAREERGSPGSSRRTKKPRALTSARLLSCSKR